MSFIHVYGLQGTLTLALLSRCYYFYRNSYSIRPCILRIQSYDPPGFVIVASGHGCGQASQERLRRRVPRVDLASSPKRVRAFRMGRVS